MVNLVDVFADFKTGKNIDRPTMVRVLGRRVPHPDQEKIRHRRKFRRHRQHQHG
jgi:hypothetical protein